MIKDKIAVLIKEISTSEEVATKNLRFLDADDARLEEPVPGIYLLTWSQPEAGDRLKLRYAFRDSDEVAVVVSLVFSKENVITEVELSRGDGKSVQHIPALADLFTPPINTPF